MGGEYPTPYRVDAGVMGLVAPPVLHHSRVSRTCCLPAPNAMPRSADTFVRG